MKNKNIVLTGFMGTGKTSSGEIIARELSMEFIDTDKEIEKRAEKSIQKLFEHYGEEYFRDLEEEIVEAVSSRENAVIATGGGVILRDENVKHLKKNGVIFLLTADFQEILKRLDNCNTRPLLKKGKDELLKLMEMRNERYIKTADFIVETTGKTPFYVAREIIDIFKRIV